MRTDTIHGHAILFLDGEGPSISTSEDASDLVGNAWSEHATLVAVPVARLDTNFFRLETQLAGEITQKLVNYHLKLAVIGDIEEQIAASGALRDFVWESNRGQHVWFLPDEAALEAKLAMRPIVAD